MNTHELMMESDNEDQYLERCSKCTKRMKQWIQVFELLMAMRFQSEKFGYSEFQDQIQCFLNSRMYKIMEITSETEIKINEALNNPVFDND